MNGSVKREFKVMTEDRNGVKREVTVEGYNELDIRNKLQRLGYYKILTVQ